MGHVATQDNAGGPGFDNSSGGGQTHVVDLPPDITAAGLRQIVAQCSNGRLVLVVPRRATTLARSGLVSFQVLRRQAEGLGLPVAIVTRQSTVRRLAAEAGLPVFGTVDSAVNRATWHSSSAVVGEYQPPPPRRSPHVRVSALRRGFLPARFRRITLTQGDPARPLPAWLETLFLAVLLVVAVVAVSGTLAFIVPAATVTLVPALEPVTGTVTVTALPTVDIVDTQRRIVPARRIGQRVEGDDSIEATGTKSAPDQAAQGSVVFTNRGPTPQQIPAGTVVSTSTGANVRFQTLAPAELPGGIGARVTVPIAALEPGPSGNVRAFAINTVEGPLAPLVNVVNPAATGGGNVKPVAVVTQGDKDRLRNRLEQQVKQKAYAALGQLLEEGEFVPPETVGTLVVEETYDRFTDEVANQVNLRLRLLATALAVDGKAADELALQALSDNLPRRGRLLADTVTYTRGPATVSQLDDGTPVIQFDVTASAQAVLDIDPAAVRATIRGLPPTEAVSKLQAEWRLQKPPEISLSPEWLLPILRRFDYDWLPMPVADRVPWLPFRTLVRVQLAR